MGSSSTQAIPIPSTEVEKNEAVQSVPQPERREAPFVIKVISGIPS
jgi:hypothetical protein